MRFGIAGFPQAGKTTVFNLLTHGHADIRSWAGHDEARVGVARIPDSRLDRLAAITRPKKYVHSAVEFVDLPAIVRRGRGPAGDAEPHHWTAFLNSLKNADALALVARAFRDETLPHAEGSVDPARDLALLELEMVLADLSIVEKRLEHLERDMKKIKSVELEAEHRLLGRFRSALEREQPLRALELTGEESRAARGFTFLSAKPLLVILNLGDDDACRIAGVVDEFGLQDFRARPHVGITAVCGKIEAEIAALPEADAAVFMEDLGLRDGGLARVIAKSYELLGLISFYTVTENEARAWAVPVRTPASKAAGMIHTDFERGFIKAEVVAYHDMVEAGSFQAARSRGLLRLEGRDYPVEDGDVILFRFNV